MRRFLIALLVIIAAPLAALGLGAIPLPPPVVPNAALASGNMHTIYVISNGFHSAIALPAEATVAGESGEAVPVLAALGIEERHFPVDPNAVRYWQIGWGSQTAYTSLRAVRDLTWEIAATALAFDQSVVHVQPFGRLQAVPGIVPVTVSDAQLHALVSAIMPSFASTEPIPDITQGFGDRFFAGNGRFSPIATCNSWTGRRLREAGVGVGVWTPIAQTLGVGLRRVQAR